MFRTSKQRSTRQLRLDPSDPAYVVLVALGDQTTEREVTEGLQLAKVDFGALDLILQAAAAGLLSYNLGTIYWDKALLHEASLSLATHELVPTVARFSLVATHDFTYQGSRRLNAARWAFYLNDDRMLAHCYVSMRDLVAYFLSASAQWVSTRSPSMASALLDHVGCGLIFHAKLPPEWQKLLSDHPDWGFPIAVMRGDLERAASCCKSGVGFEETLWFLRGDAAKAHQGFQKLIKRRKKGAVLHSFAALFAQLAALRMGDPQAALDERCACTYWGTLHNLLQEVARRVVDPNAPPVRLDFKASLGLVFLKVLEPLLPPGSLRHLAGEVAKARQDWSEWGLTELVRQLDPATTATHWGHGLEQRADWENWLTALRTRGQTSATLVASTGKATASYRLAWQVERFGAI